MVKELLKIVILTINVELTLVFQGFGDSDVVTENLTQSVSGLERQEKEVRKHFLSQLNAKQAEIRQAESQLSVSSALMWKNCLQQCFFIDWNYCTCRLSMTGFVQSTWMSATSLSP